MNLWSPREVHLIFSRKKKIVGQVYMGVKKKCRNAILSSLPPVFVE